jgi:RNA exonuclease 1
MELLRLSAVNAKLNVLFDVFVEPEGAVLDYNTRWSGITAESFAAASERVSLTSAQDLLFSHMSAETILIGHSLDSDLIALVRASSIVQ